MRNLTRSELESEIVRLRAKVKALEASLHRQGDTCELLRVQNDYLQELLSSPDEDDVHECDTIRSRPMLNDGPITEPSSPHAIHLDELAGALEASDTTRRERAEGRLYDHCPICQRTDEHAHEFEIDETEKPN